MSNVSLSGAMQQSLLSLQDVQSSINTTQNHLTTGKKVSSPIDNAAIYFQAQAGYTQASNLNDLKDAMSQGLSTIQTALHAVNMATTTLKQMQAISQQALATTDLPTRTSLQTQYNQLQDQLHQITQNDANYLGTNLLSASSDLVVNFNADNTSSITISSVDTKTSTYEPPTVASGVWDNVVPATGSTAIAADQKADADAIKAYQALATTLGASSSYITARQDFTAHLSATFTTGANNITAADMNAESANMLALQTQQSLGVSALSLANRANESVLRLFQ